MSMKRCKVAPFSEGEKYLLDLLRQSFKLTGHRYSVSFEVTPNGEPYHEYHFDDITYETIQKIIEESA